MNLSLAGIKVTDYGAFLTFFVIFPHLFLCKKVSKNWISCEVYCEYYTPHTKINPRGIFDLSNVVPYAAKFTIRVFLGVGNIF